MYLWLHLWFSTTQFDAQQKDHVFHFLIGLNDSYGSVKTQILLTEPLPFLSKIYSLILQEKKRMQIGQNTGMIVEPTTMYVNNPNHPKGYQGEGGNQNVINTE